MAKPRVFISSTFFDLRQVRADLEYFVHELGYEAILNERGIIAYGSDENPEQYAYREVELSDVLVAIIGGRFGTESASQQPYSISQAELKTAIRLGKQLYIFVERAVLTEFQTYKANKNVEGISFQAVDDKRVYEFLEELEMLPQRNPTATFETARDITDYLREQWAGLFQRFLQEQTLRQQIRLLEDMQNTTRTLQDLVRFLTEERHKGDDAIKSILLTNHPAFQEVRDLLKIPYRVLFTTTDELTELIGARSYRPVAQKHWDEPEFAEWFRPRSRDSPDGKLIKVYVDVFDDVGRLKVYSDADWDDAWIRLEDHKPGRDADDPSME